MQVQRGHQGCTSAGTDARVGGTVKARVRHVIDKGGGAQSARHLVLALVSEGKSKRKGSIRSTVRRGKRVGGRKIIVQDAQS